MNLPFFYIPEFHSHEKMVILNEENSKHAVQVLRMKKGEKVNLSDGHGHLLIAEIVDDHKKKCRLQVVAETYKPKGARKVSIGISLLKNSNRFEWFLEKATEIGIHEIIPLISERTEKQKFRADRLHQILVSAMLQSQQCWLPVLHPPVAYESIFEQQEIMGNSQKFIAHCIEENQSGGQWGKRNLADLVNETLPSQIILVGPEGDFTADETALAIRNHFDAVSLGGTRLRSETAGVVAAAILLNA